MNARGGTYARKRVCGRGERRKKGKKFSVPVFASILETPNVVNTVLNRPLESQGANHESHLRMLPLLLAQVHCLPA